MTFTDYFKLLRSRWRVWGAALLLGLVAAGAANNLAPVRYTATASSFVTVSDTRANSSSSPAQIFEGSQFAVQRVKSYAPLARSPWVLGPVIKNLRLDVSERGLAKQVTVSSPPETVLLNVSVIDSGAARAARIADAISTQLGDTVESLETREGSNISDVKVTLTQPADVPRQPSSPRIPLNLLLGGLAGLALGLVAAVLRHHLDRRIKSVEDLRQLTGLTPLGVTNHEHVSRRHPLVALRGRSSSAENYRTVRSSLKFSAVERELRHFAVTSAVEGEGKTTVATNLAISWAQTGATVCLVDADLRRPTVTKYLGVDAKLGLSDVLVGDTSLDEVLVGWKEELLSVLPAGSLPPDPAGMLGSKAMDNLVATLRWRFDLVIYDLPPLLSVTDAVVLGQQLDGLVLAVRSGSTSRDQLNGALDALRQARLTMLGTVLTRVHHRGRAPKHAYAPYRFKDRPELSPGKQGQPPSVERPQSSAAANESSIESTNDSLPGLPQNTAEEPRRVAR